MHQCRDGPQAVWEGDVQDASLDSLSVVLPLQKQAEVVSDTCSSFMHPPTRSASCGQHPSSSRCCQPPLPAQSMRRSIRTSAAGECINKHKCSLHLEKSYIKTSGV